MSRKRRRKRSKGAKSARQTPAARTVEAEPVAEPEAADAETVDADEAPPARRGGLFAPRTDRGPYPPFGVSLARGFRAVGASPAVLIVAFLYALAMWGLYSATGRPLAPSAVPLVTALPPLHILLDVQEIFTAGLPTFQSFAFAIGVMVLRAVALSTLILLLLDRLGGTRSTISGVARRLPRAAMAVALIYAIEFALIQAPSLFATLGPQFGDLAVLVVLIGGLIMLVMAPIAAADGLPAQESMRRGWRAARLPGGRHYGLAVVYFFFFYWLFFNGLSAAVLAPVTPSIQSWVVSLGATFIHVGVLGAFTYRWLAVRDVIPSAPARVARSTR